jgi:hypothetical protein
VTERNPRADLPALSVIFFRLSIKANPLSGIYQRRSPKASPHNQRLNNNSVIPTIAAPTPADTEGTATLAARKLSFSPDQAAMGKINNGLVAKRAWAMPAGAYFKAVCCPMIAIKVLAKAVPTNTQRQAKGEKWRSEDGKVSFIWLLIEHQKLTRVGKNKR